MTQAFHPARHPRSLRDERRRPRRTAVGPGGVAIPEKPPDAVRSGRGGMAAGDFRRVVSAGADSAMARATASSTYYAFRFRRPRARDRAGRLGAEVRDDLEGGRRRGGGGGR